MFAKTIMPGKFWILEESGQKVGTIHNGDNVFTLSFKGGIKRYNDVKALETELSVDLGTSAIEASIAMSNDNVDGFPTQWNTVYNKSSKEVHETLPVFTKSEKSKSFHSAGYYGIKFPNGWTTSFCPRVNTLTSYEFIGPYKTEMEMTLAIQRKKNERAQ
jgi:hypothetical protein